MMLIFLPLKKNRIIYKDVIYLNMEIYEHVFDSLLLALVGHNTSFRANCPERLTPPPCCLFTKSTHTHVCHISNQIE